MGKKGIKTVLVFGVFDGCDDGHKHFLREASKLGNELVVVVAPDVAVYNLKDKSPLHSTIERISAIRSLDIANEIVEGDEKQYDWSIFEQHHPDIIAIGHDQDKLLELLEEKGLKTKQISKLKD